MEDQDMEDCDPPGPPEVAAQEPKNGHKAHSHYPHSHHHAHDHHSQRRRNRDKGAKVLDKLANALARSSLRDDESQHENDTKLTKNQRRKQKRHAARKEARASKPAGDQKVKSTTRVTRSMVGMLPLGFDNLYLGKLGGAPSFMNNDQIRTWLKSVFDPHIENWYHECLSVPENHSCIEAAQDTPHIFAKAVVEEALDQHRSSDLQEFPQGRADACPSAFHWEKKQNNSLTFIEHSAMIACLIVRDGQRGGTFGASADRRMLHRAAAMLLTSVIMDLRIELGYFLRLLLGIEEIALPVREEEQALETLRAPEKEEQSVASQAKFKAVSKVLRVPSDLFRNIGRALLHLRRQSDCSIGFHGPDRLGEGYLVVIAGTAEEVIEAEQAVEKLMESWTTVAEEDLMELSARAGGLSIQ
jgi:hypothetical protein